jgi:phosphate transport system substrate-binding protein
MARAAIALSFCLTLAGCGALPQSPRDLLRPPSRTTVSVVGSSSTANYARALGAAFMRAHPEIEVRVVSKSSSDAPAALEKDASAVGMMSRAMRDKERQAIAQRHKRAPTEVPIAMDAIGIYVFRDNPVASISLEEIERVYGAQPRTGARTASWGELGAGGAWSSRAVVPFGFEPGRGAYDVMRELVLGGGKFRAEVAAEPVSTSVVQAVAMEQGAVGYASVYFRTARTRMLPVRGAGGKAVAPTDEAIAAGEYPLARPLYFYFNAEAAAAPTREFLRFVQSEEGRQAVKSAGGIPPARF